MDDRYIIQVRNHTLGKAVYYAIDSMSGGHPYFTKSIRQAHPMPADQVQQVMTDMARPNDEQGYPNRLAHQAGEISNTVLYADLEVVAGTVVFEQDKSFPILRDSYFNRHAEFLKDQARIAKEAKAKLTKAELDALGIR
jgi:hypothetical protein